MVFLHTQPGMNWQLLLQKMKWEREKWQQLRVFCLIDFMILLVGFSLTFGANGMYVLSIECKISKQQPCGRGNCVASQCRSCLVNETKTNLVFQPCTLHSCSSVFSWVCGAIVFWILQLTSFHFYSKDELGEECHFYRMSVCLSYLFHCCDEKKYPDKTSIKKEGVIWGHFSRERRSLKQLVTWYPQTESRGRRMLVFSSNSFCIRKFYNFIYHLQ